MEKITKLKILIVHRYFKPDKTSCSDILYEISHFLGKSHSVDVLTSCSSYQNIKSSNKLTDIKNISDINIYRIKLLTEGRSFFIRVVNATKLSIFTIKRLLTKNYDIIVVTTVPPVLSGFISALMSKLLNKRMIYYCMDLNPEISLVLNDLKKSFFYRFLLYLDTYSCRIANPVIVHSEDMLKTLRSRKGGKNFKIKILNNFATENTFDYNLNNNKDYQEKKYFDIGCLKLIFAGNVGRFQDLENFLKAIKILPKDTKVQLLVMGEGSEKKYLEKKVYENNLNVIFLGYQPPHIAKSIISQADLGIVTLHDKMFKYAYPSKIMTYLQQGVPILSTIDSESEIVQDMLSFQYGFWCSKNNPISLSNLLIRLSGERSWKKKMNDNIEKIFHEKFSSKKILNNWKKIVEV